MILLTVVVAKSQTTFWDTVPQDDIATSAESACTYMLENGLDVVNADMQNFSHLEENIVAAATSYTYVDVLNDAFELIGVIL